MGHFWVLKQNPEEYLWVPLCDLWDIPRCLGTLKFHLEIKIFSGSKFPGR